MDEPQVVETRKVIIEYEIQVPEALTPPPQAGPTFDDIVAAVMARIARQGANRTPL